MTADSQNYVDGAWVESESGETFAVTNPAAPSEVVGHAQASTAADAEAAVEAAAAAADAWAATPGPERGRYLTDAASRLEARADDATETLVREEGKTRSEAAGEVGRAVDILYYYGQKASDIGGVEKAPSGQRTNLYTKREPIGTVGLITPWNYPIAIPTWKLAPALAAGNTAVLKPASLAPGVARIVAECLDAAGLPDGVANVVTGSGGEVGATVAEHPAVDAVSFTGSTAVGTSVAQTAATDLTRVQCEMGGKNPTVVMPSADVDEAVEIAGTGAFGVTGQACTACSRAVVHTDVHDAFLDGVVEYAETLSVGPGIDDPDMGPQVSHEELASTLEYVEIGRDEGATLETGGERLDGDGHFVSPAVFSGVASGMQIAQEEIFGPVLSVIEVESFTEAMSVANDSDYGLSASVVTQDLTEANRFVDEVESGVAKVNEKTTGLELHVPFGGYKDSSTNTYREQGDAALDFFTTTKTVYENY